MKLTARGEHAKTLASVLGLDEKTAAALLDVAILVTTAADAGAQAVCRHVVAILGRTVTCVSVDGASEPAVEVLIGDVAPRSSAPLVRVGITAERIVVSSSEEPEHDERASVIEIVLLIAACYAAASAVRVAVGRRFTLPFHDVIRVPVRQFLRGYDGRRAHLGTFFLAGAGAIGNACLWALATMDVEGDAIVVDPKNVSDGNLGRCLLFTEDDRDQSKAERLVAHAQTLLPRLRLHPRVQTIQTVSERIGGAWLRRLVVAVDSRRARRRLQEELPREVFDASTTGIEEIVVHFNSANDHGACLSCVYHEDAAESAHEQHVAEMLGVTLAEVGEHYISTASAERISARYPSLPPRELVGKAYDTLFKTMCATGQLTAADGRTVLAPFAFVSALAGAVLALELVQRSSGETGVAAPFNVWRLSPWTSPVFELQTHNGPRSDCEACDNPIIRETLRRLWGPRGKPPT
jgi:molybdopterin/thiamine biosynthesis adenylyltransferase